MAQSPLKPRAVLFDKDGTLLDFQKTWAPLGGRLIADLARGDAALKQRLADAAGYDLELARYRADSPLVRGEATALLDAWLDALPRFSRSSLKRFVAARAMWVVTTGLAPASADLPGLLRRLKAAGLKIGLATHDIEFSAKLQLDRLRIGRLFDFVAGGDSGYPPKPDPAVLNAFCETVGVSADTVVVVGDSAVDLGLARNGGAMAAIAVLTGPTPAESLAPLADAVLGGIDELPGELDL